MTERIQTRGSPGQRLLLVAVFLGCTAVLAIGCGGEEASSPSPTAADTDTAADTVTDAATTTEPTPEPFIVEGIGATSRTIEVPDDLAPLVLFARYREKDVLEVNIRGEGFRRLEETGGGFIFDGPGGDQTATPGINRGLYKLTVKGTKGQWAITMAEPDPEGASLDLLQVLRGEGGGVGKVHLQEAAVLRWEMGTEGFMPLQGYLLGYGEAEGAEQFLGFATQDVIFEPGKKGLRTDDTMPAGEYLLIVDADGPWFYEFTASE